MNINIAIYSIVVLLFSFFTKENTPPTVDPSIYSNTVNVKKECDQVLFEETLNSYNEFYNHSCKHVKLKMGEVSRIQQQLYTDSKIGNIEVVYNETVLLEKKSIALTSEIVELRFYNKRKNSYETLSPNEIPRSSRKASFIEKHKDLIRKKSEKLLQFLTKK